MKIWPVLFLLIASLAATATAHEVRPAHLKLTEIDTGRYLARWKVPAMGDRRLAIDPVFESACSEIAGKTENVSAGASILSWQIECADGLADTTIQFTNLSATAVDVLVDISFLDGRVYTGLVRPSKPEFHVPAHDSESRIFFSYTVLGIEHILFGWDHLLFVLGMMLLVTTRRRLIGAITGFTIAHSLTLALAMFDVVRVPGPPVEAIIALSIVFLAVEVARFRQTETETLAIRSPWAISMAIGLVHGLGFAGALSEYGLPAQAKLVSLFAFNVGVEAGQLAFVATVIALAAVARKAEPRALSAGQFAATWFIGICGSFWLIERVAGFFA